MDSTQVQLCCEACEFHSPLLRKSKAKQRLRSQMNKSKEHSYGIISGLEGGGESSKRHPVVNVSRGKVTKTLKRKYQDIRAMFDINPGQRQSKLGSGAEYEPS